MKNKTAIITGASQGIGENLVRTFANQGSNVILISRNVKKLKKIFTSLKHLNNQYFQYYGADLSNEENVQNIFKQIINENNKIDILINNAGITSDNLLLRMSSKQWNDVINTNLNSCFYCCKSVIKKMIKQKSGKIINISSIVGLIGNIGQTNYSASKAGIIGFTKSLAKEVASRNINVNTINPGYINTNMTNNIDVKDKAVFLKKIPLNRFGSPVDVSNLACFLSSDISNYVTGQTINVDGGMVMI